MNDLIAAGEIGREFLEHYGIRGMKWGVRRARGSSGRVSTEAKRTQKTLEKKKTHGAKSLTNKELADFNKRLELERKFKQLEPKKTSVLKKGQGFTKEILAAGATANAVIAFSRSPAGQKVASAVKNSVKNAASNRGSSASRVTQLALPSGR